MSPYYYVCRVGHGKVNIKHPTLRAAIYEANRLAVKHANDAFEILQCLGVTQTFLPPPQTFWLDGVTPPGNEAQP